jgi:hypothetical protein
VCDCVWVVHPASGVVPLASLSRLPNPHTKNFAAPPHRRTTDRRTGPLRSAISPQWTHRPRTRTQSRSSAGSFRQTGPRAPSSGGAHQSRAGRYGHLRSRSAPGSERLTAPTCGCASVHRFGAGALPAAADAQRGALLGAAEICREMLRHSPSALTERLAAQRCEVAIIGREQVTSDIPEHRKWALQAERPSEPSAEATAAAAARTSADDERRAAMARRLRAHLEAFDARQLIDAALALVTRGLLSDVALCEALAKTCGGAVAPDGPPPTDALVEEEEAAATIRRLGAAGGVQARPPSENQQVVTKMSASEGGPCSLAPGLI